MCLSRGWDHRIFNHKHVLWTWTYIQSWPVVKSLLTSKLGSHMSFNLPNLPKTQLKVLLVSHFDSPQRPILFHILESSIKKSYGKVSHVSGKSSAMGFISFFFSAVSFHLSVCPWGHAEGLWVPPFTLIPYSSGFGVVAGNISKF